MHRSTALALVLAIALIASACSDDDTGDAADGTAPDGTGPDAAAAGYEATISRDEHGVPHITAQDTASLAFGQGWASGEDRPCDLADQLVKVRGERARWFGAGDEDANLHSDLAWRSIGIYERGLQDWEQVTDEVRELFTAYVDGWNGHLDEVGSDGLADWCAGEPWVEPVDAADLYAYARSIALFASGVQLTDFIATAEPPTGDEAGDEAGEDETAMAPLWDQTQLGSNGWAIGSESSETGGGMLVANPHFPWEGELRFWEAHLTIPGEVNIYGAQLSGLPGIGIGFTDEFGWTHTVSAGNRFTAYTLDLVDGDPTSYRYGEEEREMTPTEVAVEVLGDDGELEEVTRTMWSSHYGPIIDFPGFGWSEEATITYRDANIDNEAFVEQYLGMMMAEDFDEFVDVHAEHSGVPLFNTVATSADGRAWYADTSATPNLSDEAIAAYEASLEDDPIVAIAAENQAVLLDGSDPLFEWVEVDGARSPGLVPFEEMPMLEREDHVFNANDSFWVAHASETLDGDFSPLHGRQETARSPRTRENAVVLGEAGELDLDGLAELALANRGFTARQLLDEVVARCEGEADLAEACEVLAGWDGVYDLDRSGPMVWRELLSAFENEDLREAGPLWAQPFDPADPVGTPSGLAEPPGDGSDPVLDALRAAVDRIDEAGLALDAPLGDVQFADRNGTIVGIHGGDNRDGVTNIVGWGTMRSIMDPALRDVERTVIESGSSLARYGDEVGYPINNGTSFLLALAYGADGPEARAFLTYGNPADRDDPIYVEATERFSEKAWRDLAFTDEQVEQAAVETEVVTGGS